MTRAHGLDVSHWQATTPPLRGQDFVFVRATYGTAVDRMFVSHSSAVRQAGRVLGAYAFGRSGSRAPIADQAEVFARVAARADLVVLDLENDAGHPDMTQAEARSWINRVRERLGKPVGLYASHSGFPDVGQDWNWIARWGSVAPSLPWRFWQYTSDGHLDGYTGRLDMNRFNGDAAALRRFVEGNDDMAAVTWYPIDTHGPGTVRLKDGRGLVDLVTGKRFVPDDREKTVHGRAHAEGIGDGYQVRHAGHGCLALDEAVTFVPDARPDLHRYVITVDAAEMTITQDGAPIE